MALARPLLLGPVSLCLLSETRRHFLKLNKEGFCNLPWPWPNSTFFSLLFPKTSKTTISSLKCFGNKHNTIICQTNQWEWKVVCLYFQDYNLPKGRPGLKRLRTITNHHISIPVLGDATSQNQHGCLAINGSPVRTIWLLQTLTFSCVRSLGW